MKTINVRSIKHFIYREHPDGRQGSTNLIYVQTKKQEREIRIVRHLLKLNRVMTITSEGVMFTTTTNSSRRGETSRRKKEFIKQSLPSESLISF